eukprot:3865949-Rhodomonas_salina.3
MSGTAYNHTLLCPVLPTTILCDIRHSLQPRYAMFGPAYARAMLCPVLPMPALCYVRCGHRLPRLRRSWYQAPYWHPPLSGSTIR